MPDELSLQSAAGELYGVVPGDFVRTRAELVARAKANGDNALAAQIGKLRKPNTPAWLVNLLVRERPEQMAALLDLGAAMRHAQARLSVDELRKLTVQRQQVVRALATQAHGLATDHGEQVSRDALHQVGDTLQAALADPELAAQVRAGELTQPLSYSGFGPAGLQLVRDSGSAPAATTPPDQHARAEAERERQQALAQTEVDLATRALVKADRSLATAKETLTRAERDLARVEQVVAEREAALAEATATAERARHKAETAQSRLTQVNAEKASATERLDRARQALKGIL